MASFAEIFDEFAAPETKSEEIGLTRIDYVLVYEQNLSEDAENQTNRENYLFNLENNGLLIKKVKEKDRTFILIETPLETLLGIAEKIKLKLPIEKNDLYREESNSFWSRFKFKCFIPDGINMKHSNRRYFTTAYTTNLHEKFKPLFNRNENKIIPAKDCCLIAYEILSRTGFSAKQTESAIYSGSDTDRNIGIELLVANKTFSAAYPLHEVYNMRNMQDFSTDRQILWKYWARPKSVFNYQPINTIREYFGEKLAFYFSWLGFYTSWLVLPSIVGVLVFIYGCSTVAFDIPTMDICNDTTANSPGSFIMCPLCDNSHCDFWKLKNSCLYSKITYLVDNPATVFFSIFMAIWTVLFIEFWKREQNRLQFEWDTTGLGKNSERIRPEFELRAEKRLHPLTGETEPYVPFKKLLKRYIFSVSAVVFMVCLVLALVFGVIVYRVVLMVVLSKSENVRKYSGPITSFTAASINLIIIIILGRFYAWLAVWLTDMEYHRTDSNYEDSLTIKMYLFQFVNYYASIFYIAFFKGRHKFLFNYIEPCDQSGCLIELCIQLAIIMVGKQILNNIQEVLYPIVQNYWNRRTNSNTDNPDKSQANSNSETQWNGDYNLMDWGSLTLFDEYLEMVIQFGFITLFVVAFPLGPLFAFLNNILEIRIDAFKVLTQLKRPLPKSAKDIGIWLPILNIISKLGVITNGAIIAFTSEFIPRLVYKYNYGQGDLNGYVNYTLSIRGLADINNPPSTQNITTCRYRDYREPFGQEKQYQYTTVYFQVLVARLFFLVFFEHFVFLIVTFMHVLIPNVPNDIKRQINRETVIAQKTLWQTKSHFNADQTRSRTTSCGNYTQVSKSPENAECTTRLRNSSTFGVYVDASEIEDEAIERHRLIAVT